MQTLCNDNGDHIGPLTRDVITMYELEIVRGGVTTYENTFETMIAAMAESERLASSNSSDWEKVDGMMKSVDSNFGHGTRVHWVREVKEDEGVDDVSKAHSAPA